MKVNIDENKILGAIAVLENYLDGALADYENNQIEETCCLEDSIYVNKILNIILTHGWKALSGDDYEERYLKAKAKRGQKDVL